MLLFVCSVFFGLHYSSIYFEPLPVIYNRVLHACQASYYSNLGNSSKQDYQHETLFKKLFSLTIFLL